MRRKKASSQSETLAGGSRDDIHKIGGRCRSLLGKAGNMFEVCRKLSKSMAEDSYIHGEVEEGCIPFLL
jgi:hypothetical protein